MPFCESSVSAAAASSASAALSTASAVPSPTAPAVPAGPHKTVKHGEPVSLDGDEEAAPESLEFTHTIKDPLGIHARPAGELAKLIKKHDCRFTIEARGHTAVNGSVMQLMSLGAVQGTEVKCKAEGPDAAAAIKEVREFMKEKL